MSESVRAVLFDVDGTLVDTNYLHAVTWWEAFAQAGHDVAMTDIHRAIGMGSDQLLDRLLPRDRGKDQDPPSAPRTARSTRPTGPGSDRCAARPTCCARARSAA
jgi:phosphoglycolate phosphatase-like HAD superfamily hydrolase